MICQVSYQHAKETCNELASYIPEAKKAKKGALCPGFQDLEDPKHIL